MEFKAQKLTEGKYLLELDDMLPVKGGEFYHTKWILPTLIDLTKMIGYLFAARGGFTDKIGIIHTCEIVKTTKK